MEKDKKKTQIKIKTKISALDLKANAGTCMLRASLFGINPE